MRPDLNLLVVFEAVARIGSVTLAASELGLSQPAVSHALRRLRAAVNDPLFTRSGRRLVPSPRAVLMLTEAGALLAKAREMMARESFNPAEATATFRIGASDFAALTIVPELAGRIAHLAPGIRLEVRAAGEGTLSQLETGWLDLSFWGRAVPDAPFHHLPLFHEGYIGVARRGHPILAGPHVSLDAFLTFPHLVVSLGWPGAHAVDEALAAVGKARQISLVSFSFAGNIATLSSGDCIACIPGRLKTACEVAGLRSFDLPVDVPGYDYGMIWHSRTQSSPGHAWLREMIAAVTSGRG